MTKFLLSLGIVVVSLAVLVISISLYLQPNSFVGCAAQPTNQGNCQTADAIVAVSGGDTDARADAAIKLYQNGWAPRLIFSGAAEDKSGPSNAKVMERRALADGVPASAIQIDENSDTTAQNASNSDVLFKQDNISSIILVTSGYHERRATLEFQKMAAGVTILNAPTDDKDWNMWWWLRPRGWWLAGSELVKIVIFYTTGGSV